MSESSPGRHRTNERRRPQIWVVVVAVVVAAAVVTGLTWWTTRDSTNTPAVGVLTGDPDDPGATTQPAPSASMSSAMPSPSASAAVTAQTSRTVTVAGRTVTVAERTVVDGGDVVAAPLVGAPLGMELLSLATVSEGGRAEPFLDEVELTPAGSLTVRGRYRLTSCPDLLPAAWPSPVEFAGATRTYTRVEEPLHTAYALCPGVPSRARALDGLTGSLVADTEVQVPTVRLRWQGQGTLTVAAVGSASGVAAVPVELGCDGSCIAELSPGATATLLLQPVDPCPPATDDDRLTLRLDSGEVVAVTIDRLHRAVCR